MCQIIIAAMVAAIKPSAICNWRSMVRVNPYRSDGSLVE